MASWSLSAVKYPWCDGFSTTALPATRAPPIGPPARAMGKLNGLITAHTPYGRRTLRFDSFSESRSMTNSNPSLSSMDLQ